jgi:ABC-type Zn2+ transport system substrate-binding protein/surface adhesin
LCIIYLVGNELILLNGVQQASSKQPNVVVRVSVEMSTSRRSLKILIHTHTHTHTHTHSHTHKHTHAHTHTRTHTHTLTHKHTQISLKSEQLQQISTHKVALVTWVNSNYTVSESARPLFSLARLP